MTAKDFRAECDNLLGVYQHRDNDKLLAEKLIEHQDRLLALAENLERKLADVTSWRNRAKIALESAQAYRLSGALSNLVDSLLTELGGSK